MRIKNESRSDFIIPNGVICAGTTVDIEDEELATRLVKSYPNQLVSLDNIEVIKVQKKEPEADSEEDAKDNSKVVKETKKK